MVVEDRCWGSLECRIRDFAIQYGRKLKMAKSLGDKLSRAAERGDSIAIDLARGDLKHKTVKRYQRYVVRPRLKRVFNEAEGFVKSSDGSDKSGDVRSLPGAFS